MLHSASFFATCLAMLEKEIHYKLQETCYTGCNFQCFKKSMQSLKNVESSSIASVTQWKFLCNLSRDDGKRNPLQVAGNMSHGLQLPMFQKIYAIVEKCRVELHSQCYTVQVSLQLVSRCWKKKSITSCRKHVTRVATSNVSKNLCNRWKM